MKGRVSMQVGDKVAWKSQGCGFEATKIGTIVAVIPPLVAPIDFISRMFMSHARSSLNMSRNHESYLVRVPGKDVGGKSNCGSRKLYWPKVGTLKLVVDDHCGNVLEYENKVIALRLEIEKDFQSCG